MKRVNFLKAVELFHDKVVKKFIAKRVTRELAEEATQNAVVSLLEKHAYDRLDFEAIDGRVFSYLKSAAGTELSMMARRNHVEAGIFVSIDTQADTEQHAGDTRERKEEDGQSCPFCFVGTLNDYRVGSVRFCLSCPECHTVIGQGKRKREHASIEDKDLFELPNLELQIDVNEAMKMLTPLEQRLVEAVVNGTETLDGIANIEGAGVATMWRVYARAKQKLQDSLLEYAV